MRRCWILFISIYPALLCAQNVGSAPGFSLNAMDLYAVFRLPPLKDGLTGALGNTALELQVGKRAQALGLNSTSAIEAWKQAQTLVPQMSEREQISDTSALVFNGTTASALNRVLADSSITSVHVKIATLTVDQPIQIQRENLKLDLGSALLLPASGNPYLIRIENSNKVVLEGGKFTSGNSAVLVSSSNSIVVRQTQIQGLTGDGIVVTGSAQVLISHNRISGLTGSPILLHRGTASSLVIGNEIQGNKGASNMAAGIVISDREVDLSSNPQALLQADGYWVVSQPLMDRLHPPRDNVLFFNKVSSNLSSGIYVDGGVRNVIASNIIERNGKEGLCLDNGSAANTVTGNSIQQNGQRWGESDAVLAADYILGGGRLPDGTAAEKVPGVSIDNAIYNIVFSNKIWQNFGGGIKMVRTAYFNLIGMNTLFSNNEGAGASFHFFGIELGAAAGDAPSGELDFTPSRGNIIFSNPIRGTHYSGIYFDSGSDLNDVFDNIIMDAQQWSLESVRVMNNNSLNNLTNIPPKNISSGIDPALLAIGKP